MIDKNKIKNLLDDFSEKYNHVSFIDNDPICIPHSFDRKEDIEISGFFAATLAWGRRSAIISKCKLLMQIFDNEPYNFILNANDKEIKSLLKFVYRTFSGEDLLFFIESLRNIYANHGGLESVFTKNYLKHKDIRATLIEFNKLFFELPHFKRTQKHVANPEKGSAAKRLNLYLRWMVRSDEAGVDFGIWKNISTSDLFIPLDVHSSNSARKLGLLYTKQNNWKAVNELTMLLREFDEKDPVRYDYALFGLSHEKYDFKI